MAYFLGVDVGSVSTDFVVIDETNQIMSEQYLNTRGNPIAAIREGAKNLSVEFGAELSIGGVGATGSGRSLAAAIIGADVVKNEITTHAMAASVVDPDIKTIIEIGGQDSKLILLRDGLVWDFSMNTVCAAGTGSFLDRQAERLGLAVSELGQYAIRADSPVRVAGRCAVFAESDLIHKQQLGCSMENIIAGMSAALVRNYLSNVARGKDIQSKICFQGGVAANEGIKVAFEQALGQQVVVPKYHKVMGAYGAALLAKEKAQNKNTPTKFKGYNDARYEDINSVGFECTDCANNCEVVILKSGDTQIGCFSDRCGKYQSHTSGQVADPSPGQVASTTSARE